MSVTIPDPATTDWVPLAYGATVQTNVPACRVYRTTNQLIATATNTIIAFDAERYDTDNIHDNVTNNSRLTCRTAGKYLITANLGFGTTAAGTRQLSIYLNGATYLGLVSSPSNSGADGPYMHVSCVQDLAVGDYVEVLVYQTSGAGLNVLTAVSQQYTPEFSMTYIGPGLLGRGQQNISGTYALRPAANAVPPGSTYFATDAGGRWLSDGSTWMLIGQLPMQVGAAALGGAPYTTPYDGMEIILVDSGVAPTFSWRFRYNAADSSAYKWEFVGGSPYYQAQPANQTIATSNVWQNFSPSPFTIPRSGEYLLWAGSTALISAAGASTNYFGIWATSVGNNFVNALDTQNVQWWHQLTTQQVKAALSVSTPLGMCGYGSVGDVFSGGMSMSVQPLRIA
jgi:hypothetical protein